MNILLNIILATFYLWCSVAGFNLYNAWNLGGQFYIKGNCGKRKSWVERLLDGFEVLEKM